MKTFVTISFIMLMVCGLAQAQQVRLGTASGGIMIYYNNIDVSGAASVPDGIVSGYDERPSNQAYVKAQFGYTNTNGSYFQFDNTDLGGGLSMNSIFSGQPVGQSQFGFDLQSTAATYSNAGGVVIPLVFFADNTNNNASGALLTSVAGPQAWAINNYAGGAQNGQLINSLLRGTSLTMSVIDFKVVDTTYVMTIAGQLVSDGLFHWYTIGQSDTTLASWDLTDTLFYTGTLIYDMNYRAAGLENGSNTYANGFENGHDQMDFYAGTIDIYATVVPEPATMVLLGLGGVFSLISRKRKTA